MEDAFYFFDVVCCVRVGDVHHVQYQLRFLNFFERGAKSRHDGGRKLLDEPDGVSEQDFSSGV